MRTSYDALFAVFIYLLVCLPDCLSISVAHHVSGV